MGQGGIWSAFYHSSASQPCSESIAASQQGVFLDVCVEITAVFSCKQGQAVIFLLLMVKWHARLQICSLANVPRSWIIEVAQPFLSFKCGRKTGRQTVTAPCHRHKVVVLPLNRTGALPEPGLGTVNSSTVRAVHQGMNQMHLFFLKCQPAPRQTRGISY